MLIVNQAAARRFWPAESPLGHAAKPGRYDDATLPWHKAVWAVDASAPLYDVTSMETALLRLVMTEGLRSALFLRENERGKEKTQDVKLAFD